ncbi:hypothetical protein AB0D74_48045 [Streptomyces sp. NPDC048278]|uniref:hypothetical protein n=1 Tax=Streptomyces sp. NPDC048278 TaxID=3155809 RepID=UPI00342EDC51
MATALREMDTAAAMKQGGRRRGESRTDVRLQRPGALGRAGAEHEADETDRLRSGLR